jgi:hypothetical protein
MSTFAICLDPNSPNFSTSTLSSNGFSVYSNADNFTTPVAQNIPLANLLPPPNGNCPTIVSIPQGATQIIVIDQCDDAIDTAAIFNPIDVSAGTLATNCCYSIIDLPPIPLGWCAECGIEFDTYQTSSVGRLIAGNVISSCGPVTDYIIGWYLNGDYSAPAITTGYGTTFPNYQFPHPLTGNNSPLVLAGSYEGIIHDIIINGITYSSISGSANGIPIPFESCFDTVVIDPLTCINGTSPGKYSHQFNFNSQSPGATSSPTSVTYQLSPTTQYFAFAFRAFNIWDELEIKFISGNPNATSNPNLYSQPIYLEKIRIGTNSTSNIGTQDGIYGSTFLFNPNPTIFNLNNLWPKKAQASNWVQKVLTLTNLETSSNPFTPDSLEITFTPNPSNNNTQWRVALQCLDTFDCTECTWEDYPNNLPKIWKVELDKIHPCDSQRLVLYHTGCADYSDWMGLNILDGYSLDNPNINLIGSNQEQPDTHPFVQSPYPGYISLVGTTNCSNPPNYSSKICGTPLTGSISTIKSYNQIQLTFNIENDYLFYKNDLINQVNSYNGGILNSPNLFPCNFPVGVSPYYTTFQIRTPYPANGLSTINCGDNTTPLEYQFNSNDYQNIAYTEDPANNYWSITIPQTPLVNCITPSNCSTCYSVVNTFINNYNASINYNTPFTYTSTVGSTYQTPFSIRSLSKNVYGSLSGSYCYANGTYMRMQYDWYSINTIPFISSSNGWVNLPFLGGSLPCDTSPYTLTGGNDFGRYFRTYTAAYQIRFPNLTSSFNTSLSTNDFEIYALAGFGPTGSTHYTQNLYPYFLPCPETSGSLIYSYIGGVATMYSSSHFWQGNTPTLIIDP